MISSRLPFKGIFLLNDPDFRLTYSDPVIMQAADSNLVIMQAAVNECRDMERGSALGEPPAGLSR